MITTKEKMIGSISSRLLLFCDNNKNLAKLNLNNGAVSAEDFFAELFNILYRDDGCEYVNANNKKSNYPGIDLIDLKNKKAVQVTIENSLRKITDSFCKIPKIGENTCYKKIDFMIQSNKITSKMRSFSPIYQGYEVKVICIPDVLREINSLKKLDHVEDVCRFIEKAVVVPDKVTANIHVDNEAFEILFQALKDKVEDDVTDNDDPIIAYKSSPKIKKDKFKKDWGELINLYKHSIGMEPGANDSSKLINYEGHIQECFSQDLNEVQKSLILKYLRVESIFVLNKNQGEPLKAIDELSVKIKKDFNVGFLSQVQVTSFILNMFFTCDVFPLEFE